ncbi:MAG: hypothetical protein FWH55_14070 [Oscillospiraceae bacterium]|nr:hypothetical protein [Oscillospiraceae bacterium]
MSVFLDPNEGDFGQPFIYVMEAFHDEKTYVSVDDGKTLSGRIPSGMANLLRAWIFMRKSELYHAWAMAKSGKPIESIDPLK